MTDLPRISIVATTYYPADASGDARLAIAEDTFASWSEHLRYDGEIGLHVADDGTDDERFAMLSKIANRVTRAAGWSLIASRQQRHGVGASLNEGFAMAQLSGSLVLYAVDDWPLSARFDLTPWARMLVEQEDIGCIRLGPPHPWLTGRVECPPYGWILRLARHHYVDSMRPSLFHQRFWQAYGPYAEDTSAFEAERLHNLHFCATPGPDIVLALPTPFDHVNGPELGDVMPR